MNKDIVTWQDYFDLFFKVKKNPDKFVGKIYDVASGEFRKSCIIPTDYYPLNSNNFSVFNKSNHFIQ